MKETEITVQVFNEHCKEGGNMKTKTLKLCSLSPAEYPDTETPGVYQPIAEPIQYNPVLWTNKQKTKLNKKHIRSKYVFFVKIEIVDDLDFLHSV